MGIMGIDVIVLTLIFPRLPLSCRGRERQESFQIKRQHANRVHIALGLFGNRRSLLFHK